MTSNIDPTRPTSGAAFTQDVRNNFQAAYDEITALQAVVSTLQTQVSKLLARSQNAASVTTTNPPNTSSSSYVMPGFGVTFTPVGTRGIIMATGQMGNTINTSITDVQLRFGTGTPPSNGAAVTGTAVGGIASTQSARPGDFDPFSLEALVSNLVSGTRYWCDVAYRAESGTATLSQMTLIMFELIDTLTVV